MRTLLVLAIYSFIALVGLMLMCAPLMFMKDERAADEFFPVIYILWLCLFGYGGGWFAWHIGIADWMLK